MEENSTNTTQDTSTQEPVEGIRIFADLPVKATLSGDEKIIIGDDISSSESEEETSQTNLAQTNLNSLNQFLKKNIKAGGYNYVINSSLGNITGWTQWQGDVSFVEDEGVSVLRLGPVAGGLYSSAYNGIFQNNDTVLSLDVKCETTGNASIGIGDYKFDFSDLTPEMGWVRRFLVIPKDETLSELQLYNHEWGNNQGVFRIKNIQLEIGNIPTYYSPKPAPFVDYTSLEEQIVPGGFWLGEDGTSRQVYCRTFKGTLSSDETYTAITGGIWNAQIVQGYINENNQYNMPFNLIHATSGETELNYLATMYVNRKSKILIISYSPNSLAKGANYVLTVKYTKA